MDLKDDVWKKINVIGNKFMKGNKAMAANKEEAEYGDLMQQKKLRVHAREADERTTKVEVSHAHLMGEYNSLLNQNMYFTEIASDMITLQELNTALLSGDEKDKASITLMGRIDKENLQNRQ